MTPATLTAGRRDALDVWTEAGPSADAVAAAIADYEYKAAFLRWFQDWRPLYWERRHRELREAARAARRRSLQQQRQAEQLYEFAERLTVSAPLVLRRRAAAAGATDRVVTA